MGGNLYSVKNRNGSGEKEQLPGQIQQFIGMGYLKKGSILFPYINSVKIE